VGKRYYRRANFTKTLVESQLGLLDPIPEFSDPRINLSIAVTDGQRDHLTILSRDESNRDKSEGRISLGSVVWYVRIIFWMMIAIETIGAFIAVINIGQRLS
jgi:hypothetical protein